MIVGIEQFLDHAPQARKILLHDMPNNIVVDWRRDLRRRSHFNKFTCPHSRRARYDRAMTPPAGMPRQ